MRIGWILLMVGCLWSGILGAQRYAVSYQVMPAVPSSLRLTDKFGSRLQAEQYLSQLPTLMIAKGYLAASIDSVHYDSTKAAVWLFAGEQYQWRSLRFDSTARAWLRRMPGQAWLQKQATLPSRPDSLAQSMLGFLANSGYPFAAISWDSVLLEGQFIDAVLQLHPGPPYKIDSIIQKGSARLSNRFLYRYLEMQKGMLYNQKLLDQSERRLDELLFVEKRAPSEVSMLGSGALYNVFLDSRKSNVFNALVGLMPSSAQTPDNKLQIVGDVNLMLRNALGSGETIGVNWQQLQYKSPRINLLYQQPYLFSNKAGIDFQFDLFRKDTQFLNLVTRIGVPYQINTRQNGKVFYQFVANNVAYVDTNAVKQTRQLPDLADFTISQLGIEWELNETDYRYNPRKGWQALVTGMGGVKNIKKNEDILALKDPGFDFGSLYDSLKLTTYQLRLKGSVARYFPLGRQATLKTAAQAGWLQSSSFFRNELFQIGGFKLLRGFDEESIFARGYAVGTAEFRYLTATNGYLFAFTDVGWARYDDELQQFSHTYWGGGLGINFQTRNSMVNLSWAIGKRNDLPLDVRQSKIHLGFVNFF
jgi:outer membrane protein assembly factor BamA